MERVASTWRASVVDFSKRNSLLFFKPTTKTLNLANCNHAQMNAILAGEQIALDDLLGGKPEERLEAEKVAQKLLKDQKRLLEELGVSPVQIAIGFCSWVEATATGNTAEEKTTNAPIFLLQLEIDFQRSAKQPFKLKPSHDLKLNGVLAHAAEAAGIEFDEQEFLSRLPEAADIKDLLALIGKLEDELFELEGFGVNQSVFLAAFSYQDEAIYRDLSDIEALLGSDLIRALAGDGEAIAHVQNQADTPIELPDIVDPASENLILEADASQSQVISSALAGNVVVVEGPPGTGKSQTISNLLAECLARNKRVLFVAQKRAAITAVTSRLAAKGLDQLVLDLHEQHRGPQVAAQLQSSFDNMGNANKVDKSEVEAELVQARGQLLALRQATFVDQVAMGRTLGQWRDDYFSCPEALRPRWRLPDQFIDSLEPESYASLLQQVGDLAQSGGLNPDFTTRAKSWNVNAVKTEEDLQNCIADAKAFLASGRVALEGLVAANGRSGSSKVLGFVEKAKGAALKGWLIDNAPKVMLRGFSSSEVDVHLRNLGEGARKTGLGPKLVTSLQLMPLIRGDRRQKILALETLKALLELKESAVPELPALPSGKSWSELLFQLHQLDRVLDGLQGLNLKTLDLDDLDAHLGVLLRDTSQNQIPRFWGLLRELHSRGLTEFVENLRTAFSSPSVAEQVIPVVKCSISQSIIEKALSSDTRLSKLTQTSIPEAIREFNIAEADHYRLNARRIRWLAALNLQKACNDNPLEYRYLSGEARRKKAHKPLRTLLEKAPNLMLAANPIWAMSPIQAASYLPREKLFDLVIFDEASQVKPEMAISSIIRGHSVVIAGDSNQLPPTNFFSGAGLSLDAKDSDERYFEDATKDSESILEAAERVIGASKKRLNWHYRSRDERLIALSNLEIYGNSLTTFPASDTPDAIRHVLVRGGKHKSVVSGTNNNEIEQTIELIKSHQKNHPSESLGVITFGVNHLEKLEVGLDIERQRDKELDRWLDSNEKEPFFMKNLERVQGDERDAIIIFTGYGKSTDGKISMQWGPLTQEVGRRRLNVAISRAKRRMTLVSSMSSAELTNANVRPGTGVDLYLKFLEYMENEGAGYRKSSSEIPLNPFELDIKRKMESAGLVVTTQFGVGNYRLDFVIHDPVNPERFLLAVEADGASYHSGHTARERDRLRQMALEDRGWRFHRIWSTDWFRDPEGEIEKLMAVVHDYQKPHTKLADDVSDAGMSQENDEMVSRTGEIPGRFRASSIDEYSRFHIEKVVRYILSDGRIYTNDQIVEEAARYWLGLSKLTQKARRSIGAEIERVRRSGRA
jgi:very-short-patch-repair endonuclease